MRNRIVFQWIAFTVSAFGSLAFSQAFHLEPKNPNFGLITNLVQPIQPLDASVVNDSETAVQLNRLQIGCGCLSIDWPDAKLIQPHACAQIKIAIDTKRLHFGANQYAVSGNFSGQERLLGEVKYDFEPTVFCEPSEVFLTAASGTVQTIVEIRTKSNSKLRLTCSDESLYCNLVKYKGDDSRAKLVISSTSRSRLDKFDALVSLFAEDHIVPDANVSVFVPSRAPVTLIPARIILGDVSGSESIERELKYGPASNVSFVDSVCPLKGLTLTDDPKTKSLRLLVHCADLDSGPFRTEMRLRFSGERPFEVVMPISGNVLERSTN